jgi:hypothetical protein
MALGPTYRLTLFIRVFVCVCVLLCRYPRVTLFTTATEILENLNKPTTVVGEAALPSNMPPKFRVPPGASMLQDLSSATAEPPSPLPSTNAFIEAARPDQVSNEINQYNTITKADMAAWLGRRCDPLVDPIGAIVFEAMWQVESEKQRARARTNIAGILSNSQPTIS